MSHKVITHHVLAFSLFNNLMKRIVIASAAEVSIRQNTYKVTTGPSFVLHNVLVVPHIHPGSFAVT